MASESIAAAIRVSAFHNPSWLDSALDADHAWENTLIKVMEYINAVKKPLAAWRTILNGHFNRRKTDGGPIISSINDCTTIVPANGGAFEATLTIDNSLSVGDGLARIYGLEGVKAVPSAPPSSPPALLPCRGGGRWGGGTAGHR